MCPQGPASSPAVAQRLCKTILQSLSCVNADLTKHPTDRRNLLADNATVSLDDSLIHGGTFDEHLRFVYSFLYAMEEEELHHLAPKNTVCAGPVYFLGARAVRGWRRRSARAGGGTLRNWPVSKTTTDVRAFLSFCVHFRRHFKDFGTYAAPLSTLTSKTTEFS